MPPDTDLENRVVAALESEGLLVPSRRRIGGRIVAAGALVAVAVAAILLAVPRAAEPEGDLYLLALHSGPGYRPAAAGERAREYGRWARRHSQSVVEGAELGAAEAVLGPAGAGDGTLSGYFVIRAAGPAEAVALARTAPHLRHGGTVVVRRIGRGETASTVAGTPPASAD